VERAQELETGHAGSSVVGRAELQRPWLAKARRRSREASTAVMEAGRGQASTKPREETERAQGDEHRGKSKSSGSCAGNRKRWRGQQRRSQGRGTRRTEQGRARDRARHGRVGRNRGAGDDASRRQRELGDGRHSEQGGIGEGLLARETKGNVSGAQRGMVLMCTF
jgi:hypothetical protein